MSGGLARPRALVHRLASERDAVQQRVSQRRPELPALDLALRGFEKDRQVQGGVLAAALAFRLFLFLIPLVFVVLTAIGFVADIAHKSAAEASRSAGIGGIIATAVGTTSEL